MPKAALLSLYDKTGAIELAKALNENGFEIFATGGTRAYLQENGVETRDVEELTGFPPLFDGRVKTLHPKIFGAILYDRDSPEHRATAEQYAMADIRVVAVNLYPEGGEIDVGGVAMLRAAAKNHKHVTVLSDPSQYSEFMNALPDGGFDEQKRQRLAIEAFHLTSRYDRTIAWGSLTELSPELQELSKTLRGPLHVELRYGENPQSRAWLIRSEEPLGHLEQLHGKELSYNNLLDLDAALACLSRAHLPGDAAKTPERLVRAAIVKHTIPCAVAQRTTAAEALGEALEADPISAFGGIVVVDATVDSMGAERLKHHFLEMVAAPEFEPDALQLLKRKKQLRIMRFSPGLADYVAAKSEMRTVLDGVLCQMPNPAHEPETWRIVSKREPSRQEWQDLAFAWDVVRHVKSNGVVIARDGVTRGICAGQTNRVSAVQIAAGRAGTNAKSAACASDGFFPFADGLEAAAHAGCSAIIAPGGSIRDAEVIAAADKSGVALVFSSYRYFSH